MALTIAILVVGLGLVFWLRSARRAFVVTVKNCEVTLEKGAMPGAMLSDFRSALAKVSSGSVEGHFEEGGLRVVASGDVDELTEQRLRNIARLYPIASFRASRAPEHRALKATGILALFSFLRSRDE
jgi:hypothetical protein